MKYCKKCVQIDTRHGLEFDVNGVCGGCLYTESMDHIDWQERARDLQLIANTAKAQANKWGSPYDCVVGVSGGKDSTFIACYAKEKLGLNTLLVNSCPENMTENGQYNLDNLRRQGFDLIQFKANPVIAQKLALRSFEQYGHICKPYEYTVTCSSVIMADKFNIPLILNGENGAQVWGTTKTQQATDDWFQVITCSATNMGCNASDWISEDVSRDNLFMYQCPDIANIKARGIRAIFLQYYIKEFTAVQNADFSVARGLRGRYSDTPEEMGRYRIFSSIDDDVMIVNEMLKYYKLGFGRASDDACLDIREGRLSRSDAIALVKRLDGLCGAKYIDRFCHYVGIDESYFWKVVDKWVNTEMFEKNLNGKWVPKFCVGTNLD